MKMSFAETQILADWINGLVHDHDRIEILLLILIALSTIHLVLFIIKWICDNRKNKP